MASSDVCVCGHREHEHDGATRWCMHIEPQDLTAACACRTFSKWERVSGSRETEALHAIVRLRQQHMSGAHPTTTANEIAMLQLVETAALVDVINRLGDDGE